MCAINTTKQETGYVVPEDLPERMKPTITMMIFKHVIDWRINIYDFVSSNLVIIAAALLFKYLHVMTSQLQYYLNFYM